MEILIKLLTLAAENLYVMAFLLLPIYGIFSLLRKTYPRLPDPIGVVGCLAILGFFTLPFFARYSFEQYVLANLEENKHLKLVDYRKWDSIFQPLTYFYSPTDLFAIVGPSELDITYYYRKENSFHSFRTILLEYNKDPVEREVDADCEDKTVSVSGPDETGMLRYLTEFPEKMSDVEVRLYCEVDYTEEMKILREKILNIPEIKKFREEYFAPKNSNN